MTDRLQRGQGSVEFLVVFLGFAALFLGLFELTRFYRAKHALNAATFSAARIGALHNADVSAMNAELANGMSPLLMQSDRSLTGLAAARTRALALVNHPGVGIHIVNPSRQAFRELRRTQWSRLEGEASYRWRQVLPSDNLHARPRDVIGSSGSTGSVQITLQDATLLKVNAIWCHRLVTPVLGRVIFEIVSSGPLAISTQQRCAAISGIPDAATRDAYYISMSSDALIRMQSSLSLADPSG